MPGRSEAELDAKAMEVGRLIGKDLPSGVGFMLYLFNFGEGGFASYICNAERATMVKALRELADRLEGE